MKTIAAIVWYITFIYVIIVIVFLQQYDTISQIDHHDIA